MSALVAVAAQEWGFLVCDTRVNIAEEGGITQRLDEGPAQVGLPNGEHLLIPERYRKISPLVSGWIGGVASIYPLIVWSFNQLDHSAAEPDLVTNALDQTLSSARTRFPHELLSRQSARYALIYANDGVNLRIFWQDGSDAVTPPVNFTIMAPPELDPDVNQQAQASLRRSLQQTSFDTIEGFPTALKGAIRVNNLLADNSESVSSSVEIGLLLPDSRRAYASEHSEIILSQNNSTIMSNLEWV